MSKQKHPIYFTGAFFKNHLNAMPRTLSSVQGALLLAADFLEFRRLSLMIVSSRAWEVKMDGGDKEHHHVSSIPDVISNDAPSQPPDMPQIPELAHKKSLVFVQLSYFPNNRSSRHPSATEKLADKR